MKIKIKYRTVKNPLVVELWELEVSEDDTLTNIIEKEKGEGGIPVSYNCSYNDKNIDSLQPLKMYGVKENDTIFVMENLRGC